MLWDASATALTITKAFSAPCPAFPGSRKWKTSILPRLTTTTIQTTRMRALSYTKGPRSPFLPRPALQRRAFLCSNLKWPYVALLSIVEYQRLTNKMQKNNKKTYTMRL